MAMLTQYDELLLEIKPRPIRTPAEYRRALKQIDGLMGNDPSREQSLMIDLLASLVQQYEAIAFPPPRKLPPSELLAELLEARELTQAEVCRRTGISRAVLSNVLAGRRGVSKIAAARLGRALHVPPDAFFGE